MKVVLDTCRSTAETLNCLLTPKVQFVFHTFPKLLGCCMSFVQFRLAGNKHLVNSKCNHSSEVIKEDAASFLLLTHKVGW